MIINNFSFVFCKTLYVKNTGTCDLDRVVRCNLEANGGPFETFRQLGNMQSLGLNSYFCLPFTPA